MSSTSPKSKNYFGIEVLKMSHPEIRRLKKKSDDHTHHGNKVWDSSLVLMDYMSAFPLKRKTRVLEVGCGWGITGMFCAKTFNAEVTGVDIDSYVFPFLQLHARLNEVEVETVQADFGKINGEMLIEFDLLIGGDICFWDDMTKPLFSLVKRAHKHGVRCLIADPGRSPFDKMAEKACKQLGAEVERWNVPHPHNVSCDVLDVPPLF